MISLSDGCQIDVVAEIHPVPVGVEEDKVEKELKKAMEKKKLRREGEKGSGANGTPSSISLLASSAFASP